MNTLIRAILLPFASFATGAIVFLLLAVFILGIRDGEVLQWIMLIGGLIMGLPSLATVLLSALGKSK